MLTPKAIKLLIDLCWQLRLKKGGPINNGDLTCAYRVLKERGWRSKDTITKARDELLYYGFIQVTRKGSMYGGCNKPILFALTFFAVNDCNGKLDIKPTAAPTNLWRTTREKYDQENKKLTQFPNNIDPDIGSTGEHKHEIRPKSAPIVPKTGSIKPNNCPENWAPS